MNKLSCKLKAKARKEGWTVSDGHRPDLPPGTEVYTILRNCSQAFLDNKSVADCAAARDWRWEFLQGYDDASRYDIILWRLA